MDETQESVNISYSIRESRLTLHEPVLVDFSIQNQGTERIDFDLGHDRKGNFQFSVTRPDKSIVRAALPPAEGTGRIGTLSLDSRETYTQQLLLNEWYDFAETGRYMVEGILSSPVKTPTGAPVAPRLSNAFEVQILPPNPERLKRVCQTLLDKALESNVADAIEAATALSHIPDPVVIPFLEAGLKGRELLWQHAIPGLARIANRDAIEVLIAVMNDRDPESGSSLARFYLRKLSKEIESLELRRTIEGALAG